MDKYRHALATAQKEYVYAQTEGTRNVLRAIFPELNGMDRPRLEILRYFTELAKATPENAVLTDTSQIEEWIKYLSAKPISPWVPTGGQLEALRTAIEQNKGYVVGDALTSLYDDLKNYKKEIEAL
jgi:hypothetical protein